MKFSYKKSKAEVGDTDTKSFVSDEAGLDKNIRKTTYTNLTVEKNKFSISEENVELCINNVDLGGRFIELYELMKIAISKGILEQVGGYYQLNNVIANYYKDVTVKIKDDKDKPVTDKMRFKDIAKSPDFVNIILYELTEYYRTKVSTVDSLYTFIERYAAKNEYNLPSFWKSKRDSSKTINLDESNHEMAESLRDES